MAANQTSPPIAPVLHRSLLTGLLMLSVVMVVFKSAGMGPQFAGEGGMLTLAYTLSALSFVLVGVAVLLLKPRVPGRGPRQPVEEYWPSVTGKVLQVWFVMEAAGMSAIVGYFLTGHTITAVAIGVSIAAFIWCGPNAFAKA
jgi:hypothetical protein